MADQLVMAWHQSQYHHHVLVHRTEDGYLASCSQCEWTLTCGERADAEWRAMDHSARNYRDNDKRPPVTVQIGTRQVIPEARWEREGHYIDAPPSTFPASEEVWETIAKAVNGGRWPEFYLTLTMDVPDGTD